MRQDSGQFKEQIGGDVKLQGSLGFFCAKNR
jgi:hypothetical protein